MEKLDLKIFPYGQKSKVRVLGDYIPPQKDKLISQIKTIVNAPVTTLDHKSLEYNCSLFSSTKGSIEKIVFHFPNMSIIKDPAREMGLHNLILSLALEMPLTQFYVLTNEQEEEEGESPVECFLKKQLPNVSIQKVITDEYEGYSKWAKDPYLAAFGFGEGRDKDIYLIKGGLIQRVNSDDSGVLTANLAHEVFDAHLKEIFNLNFDGGNILAGEDFVLMGKDILTYNANYTDEVIIQAYQTIQYNNNNKVGNKQNLLKKIIDYIKINNLTLNFEKKTSVTGENYEDSLTMLRNLVKDKERFITDLLNKFIDVKLIHFIGSPKTPFTFKDIRYKGQLHRSSLGIKGSNQPFFHLDFFMTLVHPVGNQHQILVGEPVVGLTNKKLASLNKSILGLIYQQISKMKYAIDEVIEQLELIGKFKINRIPLPLTYHNTLNQGKIEFKWYWASYNNCLVEDGLSKKVFLPSYKDNYEGHEEILPKFSEKWKKAWNTYYKDPDKTITYGNWSDLENYEKEVESIWKKLGFEPKFIKANLHQHLQVHGSIACLTNCIKRRK